MIADYFDGMYSRLGIVVALAVFSWIFVVAARAIHAGIDKENAKSLRKRYAESGAAVFLLFAILILLIPGATLILDGPIQFFAALALFSPMSAFPRRLVARRILAMNPEGRLAVAMMQAAVQRWMSQAAMNREAAEWFDIGAEGETRSDGDAHGSARWGRADAMTKFGHVGPTAPRDAVSLGAVPGLVDVKSSLPADFFHAGHIVTCAPTRSGKGIGAVIPCLLHHPGSVFTLDVKGENYAVTARLRRRVGEVFVIDPFNVCGDGTNAFNPMDRVDVSTPDCVAESLVLADALVVGHGSEDNHFDETAKGLLQGFILHVAASSNPESRTLGEVRRLLTANEADMSATLADMAASDVGYGVAARAANAFVSTPDRERGSILSTARRHTAFLDDPRICEALGRSDFRLDELKTRTMSVFAVMPPAKIAPNARFLRLLIGSAIAGMMNSSERPEHRVVFLLDEFAQLGRMAAVEEGMSIIAGYGGMFWVFIQDLSQLKAVYPKWQTFLANAAKQFFGTADYDTARYVSESLGTSTIASLSSSVSGKKYGIKDGLSLSTSSTGRPLLTPDEVMRLGPERPVVLIGGEPPYLLKRLNYLTDAGFEGAYDPNPYH